MPRYLVTGGTHLGIVSCYGVKTFDADNMFDLMRKLRKDRKIPDAAKHIGAKQKFQGKAVHQFVDSKNNVLFEYTAEQVPSAFDRQEISLSFDSDQPASESLEQLDDFSKALAVDLAGEEPAYCCMNTAKEIIDRFRAAFGLRPLEKK